MRCAAIVTAFFSVSSLVVAWAGRIDDTSEGNSLVSLNVLNARAIVVVMAPAGAAPAPPNWWDGVPPPRRPAGRSARPARPPSHHRVDLSETWAELARVFRRLGMEEIELRTDRPVSTAVISFFRRRERRLRR